MNFSGDGSLYTFTMNLTMNLKVGKTRMYAEANWDINTANGNINEII